MKAMILAAGRGSRLKELTQTTPKPLIKVNGKPLIEYHLDNLQRAGFKEVVVNISWLAEKLEDYFQHQYKGLLKVIIYKESQALETGGGVLAAFDDLVEGEKPFLVINADVLSDFDFRKVPKKINAMAHLFLIENPVQKAIGDFVLDKADFVRNISKAEQSTLSLHSTATFSGISLLTPKLFQHCSPGKFSLAGLFKEYADLNQVSGQMLSSDWFDVGTQERLALAEQWQKQRELVVLD